MKRREKRDMWWSLIASYNKQFNETNRLKRGEKRKRQDKEEERKDIARWWLLIAKYMYIKQFNQNSPPKA